MEVCVSIILPDGTRVDREPTREERRVIAERYAVALLGASFPGCQVRVRRKETVTGAGR